MKGHPSLPPIIPKRNCSIYSNACCKISFSTRTWARVIFDACSRQRLKTDAKI